MGRPREEVQSVMHSENQPYASVVRRYLSDARYHHSLCVCEAAVALAEKYGADPKKAECAGIVHDVMKEADAETQKAMIARGNITLSALEKETPKLLHAIAGAAFAEIELGIGDREILDAIRYHTTGRPGMTLLEKVIYLADYISAERDYDGVDVMREAAKHGLEPAIFTGLAFSIRDLSQRGGCIHPDTMGAYNEMILSGETNAQPPLL